MIADKALDGVCARMDVQRLTNAALDDDLAFRPDYMGHGNTCLAKYNLCNLVQLARRPCVTDHGQAGVLGVRAAGSVKPPRSITCASVASRRPVSGSTSAMRLPSIRTWFDAA